MQTQTQRLVFGTAASDWLEGINFARMREARLAKAQAAMKKHGIAAAVMTLPPNIRYVTSVDAPMIQPQIRYAVAFAEHDPIIYEIGESLQHNKRHAAWVKPENWRVSYPWLSGICGPEATRAEAKKWCQAIVNDLKEKGLAKEKLGIDVVDEASRQALQDAGVSTVSVMPAMVEARRTKTPDEINCIRMACLMGNAVYGAVCETMQKGGIGVIREMDLAAEETRAVMKAGSDTTWVMGVTSGAKTFEHWHMPSKDNIIQFGDLLVARACAVSYMGYNTCYYRTFVVGRKPNQKERDFHKKLVERIYAVIDEVKPGATTADAAKHFLPASTWGYESEETLVCAEVGHGVGLALYEEPVVSRIYSLDFPQVFEPGMTFAVEGREGEWGHGGVRYEDVVLVTEKGYEILTTWPKDEITAVGVL